MSKNLPKKQIRNKRCVLFLTEGPSDRAALSEFFDSLYALIDPDLEIIFPTLYEERIKYINNEASQGEFVEVSYNGDISSRRGVHKDNILPLLLKLFIHPFFNSNHTYDQPNDVEEIIQIVDLDGAFLLKSRIREASKEDYKHLPYYDAENGWILTDHKEEIYDRNQRKAENLKKLYQSPKLRITTAKGEKDARMKNYRVFYFSSNLDHVLYGVANNSKDRKIDDAEDFAGCFYGEPLKMAKYFLDHPSATKARTYKESWEEIQSSCNSIMPGTNINILIKDLLKQANIKYEDLPECDLGYNQ